MIFDNIKNIDLYKNVHKSFGEVFEYLKNLTADTPDNSFEIKKDNIYGFVRSIKTNLVTEEENLEKHNKFIDVHYVISGEETFCVSDVSDLCVTQEYNDADDYSLHSGKSSHINLEAGHFCIVFPDDAHLPCSSFDKVKDVKRCVVKVKID